MAVIIEGGSGSVDGDGNESPKLGVREAFVGGVSRHEKICFSGSAVVGKESQ